MAGTGTFHLRQASRSTALVAAGATLATAGLLVLGTGASGSTLPAVPGGACTAQSAPAGEIFKNVDTTLGCDNDSGTMGMPVTGFITVHMPDGVTTATGADAIEANVKGGGHPYYAGGYTIAFSSVTGGTATGGSYTLGPNTAQYPDPPPVARALTFTASSAGGSVSAMYSLTWTGTEPVAHDSIASLTNDLFVWFSGTGITTHVRTESVKPFTPGNPTPTPTPTPTATPGATPTPTPTSGVQPVTTASPQGGVQAIHTPSTGGGPAPSGGGAALVIAGLLTVATGVALRRRSA